jgi:hypothetical protein
MDTVVQIIDRYIEMGGPGSGNWGHAGRKGKRGGSAPRSTAGVRKAPPTGSAVEEARLHYSLSEKDKGVIRRAVQNLPQDHLDKVHGIASVYLDSNVEGVCKDTYIDMNARTRNNRRIWNKASVVHEVGHAVQHYNMLYGDKHYGRDFVTLYKEKAGRAGVHPAKLKREAVKYERGPRPGFPSRYSQKNSRELFAEGYQMYTSAPRTLQKRAPDIYDYMRNNVFDRVEYTE